MNDAIYAVTHEEREQYTAFSMGMWKQLFQPLPQVLWYYTSAATFARILKTGEVWSTQISCLNDHSEFRYSVRLLREELKQYRNNTDEHIGFLARHLYETLQQDGADISWFFVFCMSSVRDDLSQWRAYGGGEGGVSIGFDPSKIIQTAMGQRGYVAPVRYTEQDHKAIVKDVANTTLKFFREGLQRRPGADRQKWTDSFLTAWRDHIVYVAPVLKDSSFQDEREWRLIVNLRDEDLTRVEIQQRSSLISRHLPLSFGDKLPIREVVVGPCRHPSVSLVSVGTYLRARGYPVNELNENDPAKVRIASSKIPYQGM